LRNAQATLDDQMAKLEVKKKELAVITEKLQVLFDKLALKQAEQKVKLRNYISIYLQNNFEKMFIKEIEDKIELTKLKLERAEKLIHGLGGEKARWTAQIKELTHIYDNIVGDVLLSAAVLAYLGAFTFDYRQVNE